MEALPTPTRVRAVLAGTAAAVVLVVHFGAYPVREHPVSTDVRHFLYYAARIAQGAVPHRDFFENKPPLAFFTGAALMRVGDASDLEPLHVVRVGYLALAALGGAMVWTLHIRLAGGSSLAGLLALAAYCGFPLIGGLPCIGDVPKLLMALGASAAALFAFQGRWLLAGMAGGMAVQDWQVGGLVIVATTLGALRAPEPRRALARSLAGTALALAPFIAYFAWHGALGALFGQTVVASVFRGASTVSRVGLVADWSRRLSLVALSPYSNAWLCGLGLAGMVLYLRLWFRQAHPPVVLLGVYHFGVLAYSLVDFQAFGDLFILQHSVVFFAAVALWSAYQWLGRTAAAARGSGTLVGLAALIAATLVWRPWVSRRDFRLVPRPPGAALTLAAQEQVARRLAPQVAAGRAAVLGPTEILVLGRAANPAPLVYWNAATWGYFRRSAQESEEETLRRLLAATHAQVVICDLEIPGVPATVCPRAFGAPLSFESGPDGYGVALYPLSRTEGAAPP
jgi:hypothetical protein